MKVSFIVPAYNVESYIEECINSVLCQNLQGIDNVVSIEVIIVNDGSTDATWEKILKFKNDSRVIIINKENEGVSIARNMGLAKAVGKWVFFLDGDDIVSPDLLKSTYRYLLDENDICFVEHYEWNTKNEPRVISNINNKAINLGLEDIEEFRQAIFNRDYYGKYDYHNLKLSTPCKFYRRQLIIDKKIEFPPGIKTGEDAIFNFEFIKFMKKGVYVPKKLYYHRIISSSVSHSFNPDVESDFFEFHNKLRELISETTDPTEYMQAFADRCLWSLGFCFLLKYSYIQNLPRKTRKRDFDNYYNAMKDEIRLSNLRNFRPEKRILLTLIKYKMFTLANAMILIRRRLESV